MMIDERSDIDDLVKFTYLRSCMKGSAVNKIAIYSVSADNYKVAWDLLVETYERKRILASKHFQAILHYKPIEKPSSVALYALHDEVRQHLSMLKAIEVVPIDFSIIEIASEKLPIVTRREWEKTLKLDVLPSLESFLKFLREQAYLLQTFEQTLKYDNKKGGKRRQNSPVASTSKFRRTDAGTRTFATGINSSCPKCKSNHPLYACPEYDKLQVQQRWEFVRTSKICRNCLHAHSNLCESKSRCKHCKKFHHTSLHEKKPRPSASDPAKPDDNVKPESSTKSGHSA